MQDRYQAVTSKKKKKEKKGGLDVGKKNEFDQIL